jgi:arsenate reductase (thioredoxin)
MLSGYLYVSGKIIKCGAINANMKILFICKSNVGRSQIAQAFYGKYSISKSAGFSVEKEQYIIDRPSAEPVIRLMKKRGFDLSKNVRKSLTPAMLNWADKIIVVAEPNMIPADLKKNLKVTIWAVPDPSGKNDDFFNKVIDDIERRVHALI